MASSQKQKQNLGCYAIISKLVENHNEEIRLTASAKMITKTIEVQNRPLTHPLHVAMNSNRLRGSFSSVKTGIGGEALLNIYRTKERYL